MTILEDYLDGFDGIIIIVSHDRYFLDRTVNRIFSFEGDGKILQYEGGYSDYLIRKELESDFEDVGIRKEDAFHKNNKKEVKSSGKDTWKQHEKKVKFSFKEQKEFETIDDDIAILEVKIEKINADIEANATNSAKLNELLIKKEEVENTLEEKMERWVYLNDLNEKIQASKG